MTPISNAQAYDWDTHFKTNVRLDLIDQFHRARSQPGPKMVSLQLPIDTNLGARFKQGVAQQAPRAARFRGPAARRSRHGFERHDHPIVLPMLASDHERVAPAAFGHASV